MAGGDSGVGYWLKLTSKKAPLQAIEVLDHGSYVSKNYIDMGLPGDEVSTILSNRRMKPSGPLVLLAIRSGWVRCRVWGNFTSFDAQDPETLIRVMDKFFTEVYQGNPNTMPVQATVVQEWSERDESYYLLVKKLTKRLGDFLPLLSPKTQEAVKNLRERFLRRLLTIRESLRLRKRVTS